MDPSPVPPAPCPKCGGMNTAGQFLCGHCGTILPRVEGEGAGAAAPGVRRVPVSEAGTATRVRRSWRPGERAARIGLALFWAVVAVAWIGGQTYVLRATGSKVQALYSALILPWPALILIGALGLLAGREGGRIALAGFLWALAPVGGTATIANVVLFLQRPAEARPQGQALYVYLVLQGAWFALLALAPAASALWLRRRRLAALPRWQAMGIRGAVACLIVGLVVASVQVFFLGLDVRAGLGSEPAAPPAPRARRPAAPAVPEAPGPDAADPDRPPPIVDLGEEPPPHVRPPAPRLPARPEVVLLRPARVDAAYPDRDFRNTPEELAFFPPDRTPVDAKPARDRVVGVFKAERHRLLAGLTALRARALETDRETFALGFDPAGSARLVAMWRDAAGRLYGQVEMGLPARKKDGETLLLVLRIDPDGVLEAAGAVAKAGRE